MVKYARAQKMLVKKQQVPDVVVENPEVSVTKSLELMKKMTVVAASTILYLRDLFPSDAFVEKKLAGERVYVLKRNDEIPGTHSLTGWLKSAFQLLYTFHLRKLMLVIQRESLTMEIYTFSFSYKHDAIQYDFRGEAGGNEVVLEQSQGLPEDIAKSVRQMVRCILVHTSNLPKLPNDCEISIKILVDENTPGEMLPKAFEQSGPDAFTFPAEVETLKLGKIETKYTTFAVSSKTVMNEESYTLNSVNSEEVIISERDADEVEMIASSQMESLRISSLTPNVSQMNGSCLTDTKASENDSNSTNLSEKLSVASLKEKTIRCICECSALFDDIIKCIACSTFQHKTCYKLLECHQVESHVCVECHEPNQGRTCSVPELLSDPNRKESALYRQALMYCSTSPQVSCKRIMIHLKVPRRMAEKIFCQLDVDGCFLPATNTGVVRNVKPDFKDDFLGRYFSAPPSTDSTHMDVQDSTAAGDIDINRSPTPADGDIEMNTKLSPADVATEKNMKRQLCEGKENFSPVSLSPSPLPKRRRKILMATNSLKAIV